MTPRKIRQAAKVQAIVKRYGKLGTGSMAGHTNEWIYENKIYPVFDISKATFYDYLGINCNFELKKINEKELSQ